LDDEDVRMIERARGLCFLLEAREAIRVGGTECRQNLVGDITAEFRIACATNLTHAALVNFRDEGVLADGLVGGYFFRQS